uniref:Uncharacterized protein n=1 Tax=Arion vulgaris TaxID=1028688 RepID=A0A0B7BED2_9EUPU
MLSLRTGHSQLRSRDSEPQDRTQSTLQPGLSKAKLIIICASDYVHENVGVGAHLCHQQMEKSLRVYTVYG